MAGLATELGVRERAYSTPSAHMALTSNHHWNMVNNGYHGWAAEIGDHVSNQHYVSRPLVCVMLDPPKLLTKIEGGQATIDALKALVEVHAQTITGFNAQTTWTFDQRPAGGAGAQHHEVVNATREQPTPTFTFVEKYGRPVSRLLNFWGRYLMMDPDAKFALITIMKSLEFKDLGPDMTTATMLFYEPTADMLDVTNAWLCVNMMPDTDGPQESQRDMNSQQNMRDITVTFTALAAVGPAIDYMAKSIMLATNTLKADPFMAQPVGIQGISPELQATGPGTYRGSVENKGTRAVQAVQALGGRDTGGPTNPLGHGPADNYAPGEFTLGKGDNHPTVPAPALSDNQQQRR